MSKNGALPMQRIRELIDNGFIVGVSDLKNIRPGSLDLTLSDEIYRVNGAFLPLGMETVEQALKRVGAVKLREGAILEKGGCYVYRLVERIAELPDGVYAYSNPKSSSGRLDIHVRILADGVSRYDSVPRGYHGPLYVLIAPKKFSVIAPSGISLEQIRFFNQDTRLDELRLQTNFDTHGGFLFRKNGERISYKEIPHSDKDGSVVLTLGLDFDEPGFEAIETGEPIDLSRVRYYEPEHFFRRIIVSDNSIQLSAHAFYILSSREFVRVPPNFACEMAPMDARSGEIRSHYAGFIDPGWGVGADGKASGQPLTLEVRSFDSNLIILHGQPITRIQYEIVIENPEMHYGEMSPNYGQQFGPALSKHFKSWR